MPDLVHPAHLWIPPRATSAGAEAVDLAATVDRTMDAEQVMVLDAILSEQDDGKWAALEAAVICSRQNLKTYVLEAAVLAKLFLFGSPLVIWSAHLFETAQESFRNFEQMVESYDHLRKRVKQIHRGNGEEAIELLRGGRLKFRARSKSGGRGLSGSDVILDEAFALQPGHLGALLPTLSAQPNPHVIYGSSPGLPDSAVLRRIRDRGRAGNDPSLVYVEWCAPTGGCQRGLGCDHSYGTPGCALDDETNWRKANPAMGRRITVRYIRSERRSLPAAEFARERMGWWDDPVGEGEKPISVEDWGTIADPASTFDGAPVLAVDATPGLRSGSIAAAGVRADGLRHVELVEHRPGVEWLVPRVVELVRAHAVTTVLLHRTAPISALIADLLAALPAGVELKMLSDQEMAAACGGLQAGVAARDFRHLGDPLISDALDVAVKRDVGDGAWTWTRIRSLVDISPLIVATQALWGQSTAAPAIADAWGFFE